MQPHLPYGHTIVQDLAADESVSVPSQTYRFEMDS